MTDEMIKIENRLLKWATPILLAMLVSVVSWMALEYKANQEILWNEQKGINKEQSKFNTTVENELIRHDERINTLIKSRNTINQLKEKEYESK